MTYKTRDYWLDWAYLVLICAGVFGVIASLALGVKFWQWVLF